MLNTIIKIYIVYPIINNMLPNKFRILFGKIRMFSRHISNCTNVKKVFCYFLPTTLRKSKNIQRLL